MASTKRQEPHSSLDQKQLRRLYGEGLLPESVFRTFRVESVPSVEDWRVWFRSFLLLAGTALVLAGAIFFFIWNWPVMRPAAKFTLLETGLAALVMGALLFDARRAEGKALLLAASILTGVLLAVCGQVYRSGTDAWEFFAGWSLLIFGWVAAGRFAPLWALWLGLVHLAVILFWVQALNPSYGVSFAVVSLPIAAFDIFLLLLRERGWSIGLEWLQDRWSRAVLLALSLVFLCLPIMEMVLSPGRTLWQLLCVPSWVLLAVGGYIRYRCRFPDLIALGLIVSSGGALLSALVGRLLLATGNGERSYIVFALFVLVLIGAGALWLRGAGRKCELPPGMGA